MATTRMIGGTGVPGYGDSHGLQRWLGESGVHEALQLPAAYLGYVALSALDGICTGLILWLGGMEVNPIADAVLSRYGFPGMVVFKFALVALVIVLCEQIMRHRPAAAKAVMGLAIGATTVPVVIAMVEFACHVFAG